MARTTRTRGAATVTRNARSSAGRRSRVAPAPAHSSALRLTLDEAFIALLIGAMGANQHVSREELARADHLIWSMKRYRRKSGEQVGRLIDTMRTAVEERGASAIIAAAARVIPARLRLAAFAVTADIVLADGKLERAEGRFLARLARDLTLDPDVTTGILDAMLVKNSA